MSLWKEPEIVTGEPKDERRADVMASPFGTWSVDRFIITRVQDPEQGGVLTAEKIEQYIREGLAGNHDEYGVDIDVAEDPNDPGGYVIPVLPCGGGWHGEYRCDDGAEAPDDWINQVKPLVPETDLCQPHGQLAPCHLCEEDALTRP